MSEHLCTYENGVDACIYCGKPSRYPEYVALNNAIREAMQIIAGCTGLVLPPLVTADEAIRLLKQYAPDKTDLISRLEK